MAFTRLRAEEVNSYYQAMFEVKFQKQDYAEAWRMFDRIDSSQLFPSETNRLDKLRSSLPPRPGQPGHSPSP